LRIGEYMRREISLNENWLFKLSDTNVEVNIPHTWNAFDGQDGGDDYYRDNCRYIRKFDRPQYSSDERVYIEFEGVASSARVILNGEIVAEHDGGYQTFRADITDKLLDTNELIVYADNEKNEHVYPQKADFTFFGGIYRPVRLIIVNKNHFDLDYYGSKGIKVTPVVQDSAALFDIETFVTGNGVVRTYIEDRDGNVVASGEGEILKLTVNNPHLWNGIKDPYLYTVKAQLIADGNVCDTVSVRVGVRTFYVDDKKGFFLNGKSYPLHGVSRHQDRRDHGNAITNEMHREDLEMIREVGANTIRLAHYQHSQYFYDLCDEAGFVVWAEIPYISEHMNTGRDNTISQMKELIIQNYHHASIAFWGVSNEITISTKDNKDMLENHYILNDLCHNMDPTRLTTLACYAMCSPFNKVAHITELVGWNLYLGWYVPGKFLNDLWISFFHLIYPKTPLAYSEYGAEGMPNLHSERPRIGDHSEEYQAIYHEFMLRCFKRHPYMWATYVWNMFDFAADARNQGGEPGMNHKGLVTYDRKTKKDSFYLYKAWWSDEPFVHICSKRFVNRTPDKINLKIYSNQSHVEVYVDGQKYAEKTGDKVFKFKIPVGSETEVKVVSGSLEDTAVFKKVQAADKNYVLKATEGKGSNWV
jgi:beta-galactosidase/beta-glucuronidase